MKKTYRQMLSLILAFSMIIALFPGAAWAAPGEITGFEAITVDAGPAGAATYADAAGVISHLNTSYNSVTAQVYDAVYGGSTVAVPVTGWTDTDTYNPAAAGSYTFTATLDAIPDGYTNTGGYTATAEVVVAADPDGELVVFNDENLKCAVCAALKKSSSYNPTLGDMKSLTELDVSGWSITDLTGLWNAVNLEKLDLSGNPLTTGTVSYSMIFNGIDALTALKELDLSGCGLGYKPGDPGNVSYPATLYMMGVNGLESLEVLDLSGNQLKGKFYFSGLLSKLSKLKELDLSDNQLNGLALESAYHPAIESIDISGNYIYLDESQDFFAYMTQIGLDKFVRDDMKNRADLFAIAVTNAGTTAKYYLDDGQYSVDAGELTGASFDVGCFAFSYANTVKVTVNGAKYTAGALNTAGDAIALSGFDAYGQEYTATFEVMQLGGDTRSYTLNFTTKAVPAGSAGITDAALQAAVCQKLGQNPAAYQVTVEDMASLTGSFTGSGLTNAEGIQYATGLTGTLRLYGSYSSLPDLSGLKVKTLSIESSNLTVLPALPVSLKGTLNIGRADSLTSLGDFTGLASLEKICIKYAYGGLSMPAGLDTCEKLYYLRIFFGTDVDLAGLENSHITYLYLNEIDGFTLPPGLTGLTTLNVLNCGLFELPADMTNLTSLILDNGLIIDNKFTDIPQAVTGFSQLENLNMQGNAMPVISADLSGLTSLKQLDLSGCGLRELPASILGLSSLEKLDLSENILRYINGSMANLSSLTELDLDSNRLLEFPAGSLDLPAVQRLYIGINRYPDLPDGLAGALGDTLTAFEFGGRVKPGAAWNIPAEDTQAYTEKAALEAAGVSVSMWYYGDSFLYSELKRLDTSAGELIQIHDDLSPTTEQSYTLKLDSGAASITVTPTAIHDDTAVTVNDASVANGGSVEVPLSEGLNNVAVVCYNAYTPSFPLTDFSNTTTYNLQIMVGSGVGDDFPAEGKTYSVGMRVWHASQAGYSMADAYFFHTAEFTYDAETELFAVDVSVNKYSWIPWMKYMDASGEYVNAEVVSCDTEADTAVYRVYAANFDDELWISPYAVPMGYAPVCRMVFDPDSIAETGSGELDPDNLADGTYAIDVDGKYESTDEGYSMTNQFFTEDAKLAVEDGKITVTVKMHGTSSVPLSWIEGMWYQSEAAYQSSGEYTALITPDESTESHEAAYSDNAVLDTENNTLTLTIPVDSITEPTYTKVYVPKGMGESTPVFRLVFNTDTLARAGGGEDKPDPDAEPVKEITAADGVANINRDDISSLNGTDNVGLTFGDVTINIPTQYLDDFFNSDSTGSGSLQLSNSQSSNETRQSIIQIMTSQDNLVGAIDLNLHLVAGADKQPITNLGGRIKITIILTNAQVQALQAADTQKIYYYDPGTGQLTDMGAIFNLTAKTATFYTDHLSTYVIAGRDLGTPGGNPGSNPGENTGGLSNGQYTIEVSALMEDSSNQSMADQFFKERAQLYVCGDTITVDVVMYGTASSPQKDDGIHMSYINTLEYKSPSGRWVNAKGALDTDKDILMVQAVTDSISRPVYMRVQTDYMGPDYKIFRLVFDESSLMTGQVSLGSMAIVKPVEKYIIKATAGQGGSINPSGSVSVDKRKDQAFTITANKDYKIKDVLADGKSVGAVSSYTFTKVTADHTIAAAFEAVNLLKKPVVPEIKAEVAFADTSRHWAEKAISFVAGRGIFSGTGNGMFSPDQPMTRGMFVTVLGRMAGIDAAKYTAATFKDVDAEKYYAAYIAWAAEKKIVRGVGDNSFAPDQTITREEVAVMFANYIKLIGTASAVPKTDKPEELKSDAKLKDGQYTVDASALKENSEELSMADQFLKEKAVLKVTDGKIKLSMTWQGTEYISMDMIKELKYQQADGSLTEVSRVLSEDGKNMSLSLDITDINQAIIMQVYVPAGMGENRPKFRLVLDSKTLAENKFPAVVSFVDQNQISTWAVESVRAMQKAGLINGDTNRRFNPHSHITRAEAAMIIAKSQGFTN